MSTRTPEARRDGRAFELEIVESLRDAGFEVTLNPGSARPRQVDLHAEGNGVHLCVEAKNRKKKLDCSDIDDLRVRLARMPSDVIGVLFANCGVTRGAIDAIQENRAREILVFNEGEVEDLRAHRISIWPWIERKRRAIRLEGRAWFGRAGDLAFRNVVLPRSMLEFRMADLEGTVIPSQSGFANAAYSLHISDWTWGEGVRLTLPLTLSNAAGLGDILRQLHKRFRLTSNGMYCIKQSECAWFGLGVADLQKTIAAWRERYSACALSRLHHSESVTYFDQLRDGWVLVSTQQRVNVHRETNANDAFLHSSRLEIHLPGIPIDMKPFIDLARETGNEWAQFRHVEPGHFHRKRLKTRVMLDPVGTVVERSPSEDVPDEIELGVLGVVARNPFFRKRRLPAGLNDASGCLKDLQAFEFIVCDTRDWHPLEKKMRRYVLEGFDVTETGEVHIIRAFGTWVDARGSIRDRATHPAQAY